jgi:oligogalacturonide lyase
MRLGRAICQSLAAASLVLAGTAAADPAAQWVDSLTGHKVVRISREPGTAASISTRTAIRRRATRW